MNEKEVHNRVLGGLFGQALGDAFAMPAYLHPRDTRKYYGEWVEEFYPGPEGHPAHDGLKAGQVTDDTEQAFSLAAEIIKDGGVSVAGAARALVNWYESIDGDNSPYVGPSSRRACQALRDGADPTTTGNQGDTDGGAMRISPVGLIHPGDPQKAVTDAALACTPSHNTRVAISGAAAVAGAIAQAMSPDSTLESIVQCGIDSALQGESFGHTWLGASVPRRIEWAAKLASSDKPVFERIMDLYDYIGSTLATSETVPCAFGILVLAKGDLMTTARYSAAVSGDADTVGAIACAIAGAWSGFSAFPADVVNTLESVNNQFDFRGVGQGLADLAFRNLP